MGAFGSRRVRRGRVCPCRSAAAGQPLNALRLFPRQPLTGFALDEVCTRRSLHSTGFALDEVCARRSLHSWSRRDGACKIHPGNGGPAPRAGRLSAPCHGAFSQGWCSGRHGIGSESAGRNRRIGTGGSEPAGRNRRVRTGRNPRPRPASPSPSGPPPDRAYRAVWKKALGGRRKGPTSPCTDASRGVAVYRSRRPVPSSIQIVPISPVRFPAPCSS